MSDQVLKDELSAENAESEEEFPRRKRLSGKKLVLFLILPLLIVGGAVTSAYFSGALDPLLPRPKPGEKMEAGGTTMTPPEKAVFYELPDLLVNLNGSGRRTNFLKIKVSLELENPDDIPKLEAVLPRIIDNFQVYLRELRVEDLRGSAGLYRLREELLARVRTAAAPVEVKDVLFNQMLIQ